MVRLVVQWNLDEWIFNEILKIVKFNSTDKVRIEKIVQEMNESLNSVSLKFNEQLIWLKNIIKN